MAAVVPEETLTKPTEGAEEKKQVNQGNENNDDVAKDSTENEGEKLATNSSGLKKKRPRQNRRLSFADEEGGNIEEVTYHDNLHYSPVRNTGSKGNNEGSNCCVIT